jgi:hypothetical protein
MNSLFLTASTAAGSEMNQIRSKYFYWLSRTPLLAVYLLFFFVQIFYNLDVSARSTAGCYKGQCISASAHSLHSAKSCRENRPGHSKVRLNKRFQPSQFIMPAVTEVLCIPVVVIPAKLGICLPDHYISVDISAYSVRGPPAIA